MDVIGPVLEARDAEIMRLHEMPGRVNRLPGRGQLRPDR
jgi:hypothetical protein